MIGSGRLARFLGLLVVATISAHAQSLSGITVGDDVKTLSRLSRPTVASQEGAFAALKWQLPNGNAFSVTATVNDGKIVYIETDWGGRFDGRSSDFPGFSFGSTRLSEIVEKFGSDGFAFNKRKNMMRLDDGSVAAFSSYQISGQPDVVVTFISKVGKDDIHCIEKADIRRCASLDAITLADFGYLRQIWGGQVRFSREYRTVAWR